MSSGDKYHKLEIYGIFFLNLAIISWFWWQGSGQLFQGAAGAPLVALGRLFGLLAEYFILVQLVLVSRSPIPERSYGFDKLNKLHRIIGYGLAVMLPFHPILLTLGYAKINHTSLIDQFFNFLRNYDGVLNASFGLIIILAVGIISMPKIRRIFGSYESWHFTHLFVYLGIGLVFGHQVQSGDLTQGGAFFYWYTLNFSIFGLMILYRFSRPLFLFYRHRFYVARVENEARDTASVYIAGRNMNKFFFIPGQYANFFFTQKGFREPHPFSFSAPPNGETIRITVKNVGDWTAKIPTLKVGARVLIDGPLGSFTSEKAGSEKFLFIAGGIGITPIRSLLESLAKKNADIAFFYSVKTPSDAAFAKEFEGMGIKPHWFYSGVAAPGEEIRLIDLPAIKKLVPDFRERSIFICGPKGMMNAITGNLKAAGVSKNQIHFEQFGYWDTGKVKRLENRAQL